MPRKVRDASLETRTARSKLKLRQKPYYRLIEPGLHIGYRKLGTGPGTWIARRYAGGGKYNVENLRTPSNDIILADDYADADGTSILTFAQAQQQARRRSTKSAFATISDVLDHYMNRLDTDGRSRQAIADARWRIEAHIRPALGEITIGALTTERLRKWLADLASAPSRIRTPHGETQKFRVTRDQRARRATANRNWTLLRAALNTAFRDEKISSDNVWRRVTPFKGTSTSRPRYLSAEEAKRLVNACDEEFRPLVQAALQTGARYSELGRLKVSDFSVVRQKAKAGEIKVGMVAIAQSKSGKSRHIVLTDEGKELFAQLTAGRAGDALLLPKADGTAWGPGHQDRRIKQAVSRAKITPLISFHGLRHTWASLAVMGGMPLLVVAKNLGHTDTKMVEKHYGHLAPSYVVDAVREHAPKFGFEPDEKIITLGG